MTDTGVRQLKAIMFTDIKGFSSMMGEDEERTVRLVREHRQIVRDILPVHSGHEHETIGDAFVVLFDSAVNAVKCASEIQGKFREINEGKSKKEQVWIRIGIHLGDIIMQDGDIYGDGVNIAARVEPLAEPGGICITHDVFLQVQKKVGLRAVSIGKKELKNITEAPELYRILLEGDEAPAYAAEPGWPRAPLWKKVLWYVVTVPMALLLTFLIMFSPDVGSVFLGAFGLPQDLPEWVGFAIAALVAAGIIWATVVAGRYWRLGVTSNWLHGPRFLIFPAAGILLITYHHLILRGQVDSYLAAARAYSPITVAQADRTGDLIVESLFAYLNSAAVDQLLVGILAYLAVMSTLFVRLREPRASKWWMPWLLLPVATAVYTVVFLSSVTMREGGGWGPLIFVFWLFTAAAILRARAARNGRLWPAWQALRSGLIVSVAFTGAGSAVGYIQLFMALEKAPNEVRVAFLSRATEIVYWGAASWWIVLVVLFAVLVFVRRKSLPLRVSDRAPLRDIALSIVAITLATIPVLTGLSAADTFERLQLPGLLAEMHPIAVQKDSDPSFYIDRRPQTLAFGHRLYAALTGEDRDDSSEEKLLTVLAGGQDCTDALASSMKPAPDATPAICVSAIEARLYCEGLGLRLPSSEEWDAALNKIPIEKSDDDQHPFTRGPFAEWTMRLVHANPMFEIMGANSIGGVPAALKPDEFSKKVGFRCAFSFEDDADSASGTPASSSSIRPAEKKEREPIKKAEIVGDRLFIDKIDSPAELEGTAAAVAALLAKKLEPHYSGGILTFSEAKGANAQGMSGPMELAAHVGAGTIVTGEIVNVGKTVWINLAFFDVRQQRVVNRISERSAQDPEKIMAALEGGLSTVLDAPVASGELDHKDMLKLVNSRFGLIKHCYEKELVTDPGLQGKITVRFTFDRQGRVTGVRNVLNELTETVGNCVEAAFGSLETGYHIARPLTFEMPFLFTPEGDEPRATFKRKAPIEVSP